MRRHARPRDRRGRRRGYLYVAVMMVSVMVSVIGFAAIRIAHDGLRSAASRTDYEEALLLARAGIEFGKNRVDRDANWRNTYTSGSTAGTFSMGNGSFEWRLDDEDSNLADDVSDSVWLVGIGRVNDAVVVRRARLIPHDSALDCLGLALCSNANVALAASVDFATDAVVHSNGTVRAINAGSSITGDASAAGTVTGTITGTATDSAATRTLPGSDVFDFYLDNGTRIDVDDIPGAGVGAPVVENLVLAPTTNPFGGGTNPTGIYVIDCEGKALTIRNCRIMGTLLLLNPASSSTVSDSVLWEPAVPNYPALLVSGSLRIEHGTASLSEATQSTNFNPSSVPYHGATDADTSDTFPSHIRGITYVSGTLVLPSSGPASRFVGSVVAGAITANSSADFSYSDIHLENPPPGFRLGPKMALSPSSWHRVVAP